jgi:DNA-binding MarR family transcriptional regulator
MNNSESLSDERKMESEENWAAQQSPGFLLWNLENIWQREQRRALEPFGITPVQFLLLSGLAAKSADQVTVSQVELAKHCRTDPMMTSQVIRTLSRLRLVERTRDREDKRAFSVCLTIEGHDIQQRAEATMRQVDEQFFAPLGNNIPTFTNALRLLAGERPRQRVQATSRIT